MSDAKLREVERRWRETGNIEDEAAYLTERVRSGELSQSRLELAAYVGYAPAHLVLGDSAPLIPEIHSEWLKGLARFGGDEVQARVVLILFSKRVGDPELYRRVLWDFYSYDVFRNFTNLKKISQIPDIERTIRERNNLVMNEEMKELKRELENWALGNPDKISEDMQVVVLEHLQRQQSGLRKEVGWALKKP